MTTKRDGLEIGTRVYYTGDMANPDSGFGHIVEHVRNAYADHYWVEMDGDNYEDGQPHRKSVEAIALESTPTAGSRFWLADDWNRQRMEMWKQTYGATA
jgi:hypothetical protein